MSTWEENVRKVTPYTPGEQPNRPQMIKLNTNENPYPPAPGVAEVLRHPDEDALRRYPDPAASVLVNALAENYHVKPEQVFVGVGSDDVLAMAFMTFFNSEKPILFPDISYSFYPVWAEYENLLVVQTFSKSRSLAGMRIGFAIGSPKLIKYLNDVKYSFNSYTLNQTSLACGVEAVKDQAYFNETRTRIMKTREHAKEVLGEMGFSFPDSKANFLFITHPDYPAKELFQALRQKDIYVRYFDQPRINNYLRVTIGTDEQMEAFYEFLRDYMR